MADLRPAMAALWPPAACHVAMASLWPATLVHQELKTDPILGILNEKISPEIPKIDFFSCDKRKKKLLTKSTSKQDVFQGIFKLKSNLHTGKQKASKRICFLTTEDLKYEKNLKSILITNKFFSLKFLFFNFLKLIFDFVNNVICFITVYVHPIC